MSNALFYTFSTIAQTLGGALALLAAFLLYRLQLLSASIDRDAEQLHAQLRPHHGRADDILHERKYTELIAAARKGYIPSHLVPEYQCTRLERTLSIRADVLKRFRRSLFVTIAVICYSVVVLVLTPVVSTSTLASIVVFVVGVGGLASAVAMYVTVLTGALSD